MPELIQILSLWPGVNPRPFVCYAEKHDVKLSKDLLFHRKGIRNEGGRTCTQKKA